MGRAIALAAGQQGATVFATGRDADRLNDVGNSIRSAGGVAHTLTADLTRALDIKGLRDVLAARTTGLDALIHCAGSIVLGTIESSNPHDLDQQYGLNLRAPCELTRSMLPFLRVSKGYVVFLNSTAGLVGSAGPAGYAASKHGLRGFADALRDEVNPDGIRVASVFLGRTATPMQETVHAQEGRPYHPDRLIQPADVASVVLSIIGLPPTAEITEVRLRPSLKPLSSSR